MLVGLFFRLGMQRKASWHSPDVLIDCICQGGMRADAEQNRSPGMRVGTPLRHRMHLQPASSYPLLRNRTISFFITTMDLRVTLCTERDQVQFAIVSTLTAEFLMMNFEITHRSAGLAPPAITS
jgi:hypothetical protein